jgi:hypothetical protein
MIILLVYTWQVILRSRDFILIFNIKYITVKLSNSNHLPKRTELSTSSSRWTALELFYYFCVFFVKSSVRSKRTSKLTEYDAFKWWRNWIMFNWSNRTELLTKKNTKISKKFRYCSSWQNRVRFGLKIY